MTLFNTQAEKDQGDLPFGKSELPNGKDFDVPFSMFFSKIDNGLNPDTFLPESYLDLNRIITWSEVVELLSAYAEQEFTGKTDAPLFVPTCFTYSRAEAYATKSSLIVLDVDDDDVPADERVHFGDAITALQTNNAEAIVYTSASNRDGYRFRIIIPLNEMVTPEQHKRVVISVCEMLRPGWRPDTTKMNCYSMFYVPGLYASADNAYIHLAGDVHDAVYWCPRVFDPLPEPPTRTTIEMSRDCDWNFERVAEQTDHFLATAHGRHNAIYSLMVSAAMSARHWSYDLSADELAEWARQIQHLNHGSSPRSARSLLRAAHNALDNAAENVAEPIIEKIKKPEPVDREPTPEDLDDGYAELFGKKKQGSPDPTPEPKIPPRLSRFRTRGGDKLAPPPQWLIALLIEEGTNNALYAPMSFLKSFCTLDIAYAVATGKPALGSLPVIEPGMVIYYAGEGYHDVVKKRAVAWEIAHGYEPYSVDTIIFGNEAPFINDKPGLDRDVEDLQTWLNGKPAKLVVIDTLNRALNGLDEDRAHTASQFHNTADNLRKRLGNAAALTVAHKGKDLERGGRGSSAFEAGFDTVLDIITHHKNDQTGVHTICIAVKKLKSGDDGAMVWMQSQVVETPEGSSLVLLSVDTDIAMSAVGKGQNVDPKRIDEYSVELALQGITDGGLVTSGRLVKTLAERTGKTISAVEKALERGMKSGRLEKFVVSPGKWALPEMIEAERFTDKFADMSATH